MGFDQVITFPVSSNIWGNYNLVGGLKPSEKYESQLGWLFPIYGKVKNVPNHQSEKWGYKKTLQKIYKKDAGDHAIGMFNIGYKLALTREATGTRQARWRDRRWEKGKASKDSKIVIEPVLVS